MDSPLQRSYHFVQGNYAFIYFFKSTVYLKKWAYSLGIVPCRLCGIILIYFHYIFMNILQLYKLLLYYCTAFLVEIFALLATLFICQLYLLV